MTLASDPLTGALRLVAPDRAARFARSSSQCPFCLGHEELTPRETGRIAGADGSWQARSFPNLFPLTDPHEVLVPTPRHVTSWRALTVAELEAGLALLLARRTALQEPGRYVHAFVNDGAAAGASIPHVHAQLVVVDHAHGAQLMTGVRAGSCALCALLAGPGDELVLRRRGDLVLLAHPAPRLGGGLLITPAQHTAAPSGVDVSELAALLADALLAVDPALDLNIWLAADGDDTHWYLEVQPRSAGIAGVELALGIHVIAEDPASTAAAARRRLHLAAHAES